MSEVLYYEFYENNQTLVASNGSTVVIRDRIAVDDGSDPVISAMLKNYATPRNGQPVRCVKVEQAQAESVQASFALGDATHQLRARIREEERAKLMAQLGNNGIATSANVNLPHAGQTNALPEPEVVAEAEATEAQSALAKLASKTK